MGKRCCSEHIVAATHEVCSWPWLCKNSTRYNRTRNFGLYGHAESKKTQKFVLRSALRPNQISFSHGQDPECRAPPLPLGPRARWLNGFWAGEARGSIAFGACGAPKANQACRASRDRWGISPALNQAADRGYGHARSRKQRSARSQNALLSLIRAVDSRLSIARPPRRQLACQDAVSLVPRPAGCCQVNLKRYERPGSPGPPSALRVPEAKKKSTSFTDVAQSAGLNGRACQTVPMAALVSR